MKMTTRTGASALAFIAAGFLAGCSAMPSRADASSVAQGNMPHEGAAQETSMFTSQRVTEHRGPDDDLLTAGVGMAGLWVMAPPAFADTDNPTPAELRRRAIWSNWRGIADIVPGSGYGTLYGTFAAMPGREFSALATLPGASQPHRVLVQLPDNFDRKRRCVVVAPASGSRGVYGAIAVAAPWALPKGCAVVYTDKGAGNDYYDVDARQGIGIDGTVTSDRASMAFAPAVIDGATGVAFKHAHSQDNPEADWGRHVKQAAEYALQVLNEAYPGDRYDFDNTRVIAVGISNGGGAVLRAAELAGDWLDAVVAGEPNIYVEGDGGRPLYDFATEAALLMPCALLHVPAASLPQPPLRAQVEPLWTQRCESLKAAGKVEGDTVATQAASAYEQLRAHGWTDGSLHGGAASVGFDLWRAVAVTYASAYGRYGVGEHPCGYGFSSQEGDLSTRAATAGERAAWWSDAAGIPPGNGVGIIDSRLAAPDVTLPGLQCLRGLWDGDSADAQRVRAGIAETRASLPRAGLPIIVTHGLEDGLVPPAFSSAPYVKQAQAAGRDVRYWQIDHGEHFDAFLAFPDYAARFVPSLPYVYAALDRVDAFLDKRGALPADEVIRTTPRGTESLTEADLAIPAN